MEPIEISNFRECCLEVRELQSLTWRAKRRRWEALKKARKHIEKDFSKKHYSIMRYLRGEFATGYEGAKVEFNKKYGEKSITMERIRQVFEKMKKQYNIK